MDCIIVDDDELSRKVLQQLIAETDELRLIKTCSRSEELVEFLKFNFADIIFLDIKMPGMSGIEFIRTTDSKIPFILTTSYKEYALEAFDLNAVDYLIKPITLPRFLNSIEKVKLRLGCSRNKFDTKEKNAIFIKRNAALVRVQTKEILWVQALGDYISVNTINDKYTLHLSLKEAMNKLPFDKFIRVHRSFVINLDYIISFENMMILLDKKHIPVGTFYKENLLRRLCLL